MEDPSAILYLLIGIGCLFLYRLLKKVEYSKQPKKESI